MGANTNSNENLGGGKKTNRIQSQQSNHLCLEIKMMIFKDTIESTVDKIKLAMAKREIKELKIRMMVKMKKVIILICLLESPI